MKGKLYGVGVGPGDPELITLKALKIIERVNIIVAPDGGHEAFTALEIVYKAVDLSEKEILKLMMPMTRNREELNAYHDAAARAVIEKLEEGSDAAFLTLGDPTIYSTYMYIHRRVADAGYETLIVEGVTSFCAAAARLNISLCEGSQELHIIPGAYPGEDWLKLRGTKVLMKSGKALSDAVALIEREGLLDRAMMVERCGMEGERVYRNLAEAGTAGSYFSIIVVKE